MKIHFTLFALAVLLCLNVTAQQKLSNSKTSGDYTYIYQLTDKEMLDIAIHGKYAINDSYLHTKVDSFKIATKYSGKLSYGNYLYATPIKNKWEYTLSDYKNVEIAFVNDQKHFQFYVKDLKGNLVKDAEVQIGKGKKATYDQATGLYKGNYQKKDEVIKVKYQNVSNFFSFEINERYNYKKNWSFTRRILYSSPIRYTWMPIKNLYRKIKYPNKNYDQYKGYMVFSKPKYKPLDTVQFKAFVVDKKGKEIKAQDLDVVLYKGHTDKKTLTSLKPYRNGAYEYSFVLADSLNMTLDKRYQIWLVEKGKKSSENIVLSDSFIYEEYELKSIDFKLRASKSTFAKNDSVTLFMKATDENELAVPDGRVKLSVITSNIKKYFSKSVFTPDTLWTKEIKLDPVGETKLIIPAHVFPDAEINFKVNAHFLNSNNESKNANVNLTRENENADLITVKLEKDSLAFYNQENKPFNQAFLLKSFSFNDELLDSATVNAHKIKADYRAEYYELFHAGKKQTYYLTDNKPELSIAAQHTKDSVRVKINNEHKIPFWYTVFSGNAVKFKGYATQLDTLVKHSNTKAVHISISYFWDNEEKTHQASTFYNPNELNVKLIAPDVVYPGQKVNMLVKVTDVDSQPVANVDVTAYAHTTKFGAVRQPNLPRFSKNYYSRKLKETVEANELTASGNFKLLWAKWAQSLRLDTVEYYKFTNHSDLYITTEKAKNNITQFAPFVINDGEIEPVNVVYVDDVPVFFDKADQLTSYSFDITPGKHEIGLRTASKKVVLKEVEMVAGKKTIFSVSSQSNNANIMVTAEKNVLSNLEAERLDKYMMRITNFRQPYEKLLLSYDSTAVLLNAPQNNVGSEFLVGPFKENLLKYQTEDFSHQFIRESGYTYTFLPSLLKQKSYRSPFAFDQRLSSFPRSGNGSYLQQVIDKVEIDSIWNDYLDLRSYTTALFQNEQPKVGRIGKLRFKLADSLIKAPYLKNIVIYQPERPSFMHIYPGNMHWEISLEEGTYKIMLLLKDNSYYLVENVKVKPNGVNYYEWTSLKTKKADQKSLELDKYVKSLKRGGNKIDAKMLEVINDKEIDDILFNNLVTGRILAKSDKTPLPGVAIKVVGTKQIVSTNQNGYFKVDAPKRGKLSIMSVGYNTVEKDIDQGNLGDIYLEETTNNLQEVVVTGYGTMLKSALTGSVSTVSLENALAGKVAGVSLGGSDKIMIRGAASINANEQPLVIIDGVPFAGDVANLSKDDLADITILKDASATAIYGARAANGVIIIKTKKGNTIMNEAGELVAQQQTMRTNFSDVGFWKPKLNTNQDGDATFTVKFPDDITSWNANVIAMNGKKQSGTTTSKIKSFKSLSANLTVPQFAIKGDSINVIGKLMNYSSMEEKVLRKMSYNQQLRLNSTVTIKNSLIDTIPVKAMAEKDSLYFEYTLTQDNGYFDGEIRKVPVFEKGVKETKGYFNALHSDTTINYNFDKRLGKVTVRAEASLFPVLLDEMEQLHRYEYLCNEQMASKLKGLLLQKQLKSYLKQDFKYEKEIKNLIRKLSATQKSQGTWGWWQDGDEEIWISLHVVEALLLSEKEGYQVKLNKDKIYNYLRKQVVGQQDYSKLKVVELLKLLNSKEVTKDWLQAIEKSKTLYYVPTLYDKLSLMRLKQEAGVKVNIDSLLKIKKNTMFGNSYWGENKMGFWDNHIQNTLLAYKILKASGSNEQEQQKIINYFLEQRKDGKWRNTYESSLILETILAELLKRNADQKPAELVLNGNLVKQFPYQQELDKNDQLSLQKKGAMPIYFTAYQQFQNTNPTKIDKDFVVRTSIAQKGKTSQILKAGEVATLKVEVEVKADADYVMIEVPIPAGCSYENKSQGYWRLETHREYFKEKTSIFCTKLKQGKYTFEITLMPRYNGQYTLNPAKAEMMYFPVFFGREDLKNISIN
ncbi:alpha-2-macroglobulin family protein [Pedobacter sp.]|uniref:alpha-2-macroglobulin family protein n=1 Tax=Pedobacter sp. TaxID=1411316 RepID=UPI0031D19CE2